MYFLSLSDSLKNLKSDFRKPIPLNYFSKVSQSFGKRELIYNLLIYCFTFLPPLLA